MVTLCYICGYAHRQLYGPRSPEVPWVVLCRRGWNAELLQCPSCQQLWMRVHYEPWEGYPHAVPWPFDEATWRCRADPGETSGRNHFPLERWHMARIYELLDAATPLWRASYLSEGVTGGCVHRFRPEFTSEMLLHGEGELSYDDIRAR